MSIVLTYLILYSTTLKLNLNDMSIKSLSDVGLICSIPLTAVDHMIHIMSNHLPDALFYLQQKRPHFFLTTTS